MRRTRSLMSMPHSAAFERSRCSSSILGIALLTLACEEPARDLGQTGDTRQARLSSTTEPAQFLSDFRGVWIGEMEDALAIDDGVTAYHFPSGSTRVRLEVTDAMGTSTLTFGDAEPPAPPTDPSLGYPPDPSFRFDPALVDYSNVAPTEGFVYSTSYLEDNPDLAQFARDGGGLKDAGDGQVAALDGKLSLSFFTDQPLVPWCALQTDGLCDAVLANGIDWDEATGTNCQVNVDEVPESVDCQRASQCLADRCSFHHASALYVRLSSDGLVGAFSELELVNERGYLTYPGLVRFRREPIATLNP
jgi:hypothetical protein